MTEQERPRGQWARAWDRFRANRLALGSLVFCALLVLAALAAPLVAPHHYAEIDYTARLAPIGAPGHPLGTDLLGRDIASRLVYGLRTALIVAFGAEVTALVLALLVGLVAGYRGGRVEQGLMGLTDVMYAFPSYLFAVVLVTVLGRSLFALILAIGIASWVTQARLVRAQVLTLKQREYVEAARAMGARGTTIAVKYILPNAIGPILVTTSFAIPAAISAEAGLALLGLGVQPPTPSWGAMITDGMRYLLAAPHVMVFPATLFALTLLAFTWVGDGLRDAFDPTAEQR
ncbi:peptide/nickel transport system permease protein [Actinopolymorpha cephalotaxi]|uniref:Peptide/nickel transport system permease protein n=1 Tax=Actinopolymorpha cephalotaxi TaxID=504797 RepID=A0A1I2R766_9ACTN|nr:ABC transporter permease [Actinopolymorpha cephalotaxi]NYH82338.1 peptide/nickel transport system permease protein [Actinopolymorpha cephalotaxi]SFG36270.1 peptide/nickel transport system permease protein [Actinopolymorpha cephalotaxi]